MTAVLCVMWILGHYFNRSSLISGRSLLRDQIHVYCNCYPLLCNQSKLVHCVKLHRTELAKSFIISVLSVLKRIPLNRSSVGCSVMHIYIDNPLHPVSYCRGHGLDRGAGSRCPHHAPVKVIQPIRTVGAV